MRSVGKVIQSSIALGLAMATASTGGGMRLQVLHTGAGVARREAYQDRRAEDRAVLDQVDAEAVLRAESATQRIVRVEAGSIVVDAEGANYALCKEDKRKCSVCVESSLKRVTGGAASVGTSGHEVIVQVVF